MHSDGTYWGVTHKSIKTSNQSWRAKERGASQQQHDRIQAIGSQQLPPPTRFRHAARAADETDGPPTDSSITGPNSQPTTALVHPPSKLAGPRLRLSEGGHRAPAGSAKGCQQVGRQEEESRRREIRRGGRFAIEPQTGPGPTLGGGRRRRIRLEHGHPLHVPISFACTQAKHPAAQSKCPAKPLLASPAAGPNPLKPCRSARPQVIELGCPIIIRIGRPNHQSSSPTPTGQTPGGPVPTTPTDDAAVASRRADWDRARPCIATAPAGSRASAAVSEADRSMGMGETMTMMGRRCLLVVLVTEQPGADRPTLTIAPPTAHCPQRPPNNPPSPSAQRAPPRPGSSSSRRRARA